MICTGHRVLSAINLCWYFQGTAFLPSPLKPGLDPWAVFGTGVLHCSSELSWDETHTTFLSTWLRFCVFIPAPGSRGWKWPGRCTDMEVSGWLVVRTVLSSWCGVRNLLWDCLWWFFNGFWHQQDPQWSTHKKSALLGTSKGSFPASDKPLALLIHLHLWSFPDGVLRKSRVHEK